MVVQSLLPLVQSGLYSIRCAPVFVNACSALIPIKSEGYKAVFHGSGCRHSVINLARYERQLFWFSDSALCYLLPSVEVIGNGEKWMQGIQLQNSGLYIIFLCWLMLVWRVYVNLLRAYTINVHVCNKLNLYCIMERATRHFRDTV